VDGEVMDDVRNAAAFDRAAVAAEYEDAGREFHRLLGQLDPAQLRRSTDGTKWTNKQLLFHLLFGYLVVRALLVLVRVVSRLPAPIGRGFAGLLNASTRPFDAVNYWGSKWGAVFFTPRRLATTWDRVTASLLRRLRAEREGSLARSMPFPTRWDPFFQPVMTLGEVYRYPSRHFWFHRQQLSAGIS
jgi:hypothetical protein